MQRDEILPPPDLAVFQAARATSGRGISDGKQAMPVSLTLGALPLHFTLSQQSGSLSNHMRSPRTFLSRSVISQYKPISDCASSRVESKFGSLRLDDGNNGIEREHSVDVPQALSQSNAFGLYGRIWIQTMGGSVVDISVL